MGYSELLLLYIKHRAIRREPIWEVSCWKDCLFWIPSATKPVKPTTPTDSHPLF